MSKWQNIASHQIILFLFCFSLVLGSPKRRYSDPTFPNTTQRNQMGKDRSQNTVINIIRFRYSFICHGTSTRRQRSSGAHPCWALGVMIYQFCPKMAYFDLWGDANLKKKSCIFVGYTKYPIHATATSLLLDVYNRLLTDSGINKKSQITR